VFPQVDVVPSAKINVENARDSIRIVRAGGWLVDKKAVAEGRYEVLAENARRLVEAVRKARNP